MLNILNEFQKKLKITYEILIESTWLELLSMGTNLPARRKSVFILCAQSGTVRMRMRSIKFMTSLLGN